MPSFYSCSEDLISILNQCSKDKNIIQLLRLKNHMRACGLEVHPSVGNYLISVLMEFGRVFYAHKVFERMSCRNESLWNSLIVGYFKQREFLRILIIYKKIKEDCLRLDGYTFVILLKTCALLKDMEVGHELHSHVSTMGLLESNAFVCSTLVDMYAKCGCITRAQEVFDQLSVQTVVIWNTLITGYIECGECEKALHCFQHMQYGGIPPDDVTFICMLKACSNLGLMDKGMEIYVEVVKKGFDKEVVVGSMLVDMYAKCGCLTEAQIIFDRIPDQNIILWNVLITGYLECGYNEHVYQFFKKMQIEGISSNAITLICMLKTCARLEDIGKCQEVYNDIVTKGLETCLEVGSALVEMYSKNSCIEIAKEIFDKLPLRDVISWNTIIAGCIEQGRSREAVNYFDRMQHHGLCPDCFTFVVILKACDNVKDFAKLQEISSEIVMKGLEKDLYVGSTLVEVYARCDLLLEAREVFERLPSRDLVTWNVLITGYVEHGWDEEALKCFEKLKDGDSSMDDVTFVSVLKACCSLCDIMNAQRIHSDIMRRGFLERDAFSGSALVDVYAKCGFLAEAQNVFDKLPLRDEVSWTVMIAAYIEYDQLEDAFTLVQHMKNRGIPYSAITLVCILKAIGSMNATNHGREIHSEIIQRGMLEGDAFIISALVDMYSKCGAIAETQDMFDKLRVHDGMVWTTYIDHLESEEAIQCYEKMQNASVPPHNLTTFIFVLKACANVGATIKGQEIHAEIIKKGLDNELVLSNTLIYMYAKCSLLEESQAVYKTLLLGDQSSSSALIIGCLESGHGKESFYWYNQLQNTHYPVGFGTYICSLKACGSIGSITEGQIIHDKVTKKGLESENLVGSIFEMYVKCGLFEEGRDVFDSLPAHSILAWNTLISGYVEHDCFEEAINCIEKMQQECITPDAITFISILKMCGNIRYMDKGQAVHAEIVKKGLETKPIIGNILVDMYSKCFSLPDAQEVFDMMPARSVIACTALSSGYVECGHSEVALDCLQHMQTEGISMSIAAFICGLKACREIGSRVKGRQLHIEIIKRGLLEIEVFIGSILLDMYVNCGLLAEAQVVFDRLPVRDVVSWTALITGFTEHGYGEDALHYHEEMKQEGITQDAIILVCSLKACTSIGASEKGQQIHGEILKKGLERDDIIRETLVDLYAKCGLLRTAKGIFDGLMVKDLDLWNVLIAGYAQLGDCENVYYAFERMVGEGIEPSLVTFLHVLNACSHGGLVAEGHMVMEAMNRHCKLRAILDYNSCKPTLEHFCFKVMPTLDHFSCIVDILGRAGCIDQVLYIINEMPFHPDNVIWLTLLGACKKWGNVEHGRLAFDHAVGLKVKNAAAYVCMSNIYAVATTEMESSQWEHCLISDLAMP